MDPIMREVASIIAARGNVSSDEIERYLEEREPDDYVEHIAPGINRIEDAIAELIAQREDRGP